MGSSKPSPRGKTDAYLDRLDGLSDIHVATRRGDLTAMKAVLAARPEAVEATGHMGQRPLRVAVERGDLAAIDLLLRAGANVDSRRSLGDTPLFVAPTAAVARVLIDAGASRTTRDRSLRYPLHWAAQFSRPDVLALYLDLPEAATIRDLDGHTALHWACGAADAYHIQEGTPRTTLTCVRYLIDAGADVNARGKTGNVPLLGVAMMPDMTKELRDGELKYTPEMPQVQLEIVRLLLQHGADPHLANNMEHSPAEIASPEVKKLFSDTARMGREAAGTQSTYRTMTHHADGTPAPVVVTRTHLPGTDPTGTTGSANFVELLVVNLDRHANEEAPHEDAYDDEDEDDEYEDAYDDDDDDDGVAPENVLATLFSLTRQRSPAEAKSFEDELDGFAEIFTATRQLDIPRMTAILAANPEAVRARGHMGRTPLHLATQKGSLDAMGLLLQAGAEIDAARPRGDTPLFWAPTALAAGALLYMGASNAVRDSAGRAPLHWAAQFSRYDVVQLLIHEHKDPVDLRDGNGCTPLHWVCGADGFYHQASVTTRDTRSTVQYLLTAGADVNARTESGSVPLHGLAVLPDLRQRNMTGALTFTPEMRAIQLELVGLLLARGADPYLANRDGERPIDIASDEVKTRMEAAAPRT